MVCLATVTGGATQIETPWKVSMLQYMGELPLVETISAQHLCAKA